MDLMQMLQGQLGQAVMSQLGQEAPQANEQQVSTATSGIMQMLMGALANNVQQPGGAEALSNALNNDHDGSILDDIMGVLGGNANHQQAGKGAGILGHILGEQQNQAVQQIGQSSGLDAGTIMSMMVKFAPLVMGILGRQQQQQGLDSNGLASLLMGAVQPQQQQQSGMMGMLNNMLDRDGDGSAINDVMDMGKGLLGGFLKK